MRKLIAMSAVLLAGALVAWLLLRGPTTSAVVPDGDVLPPTIAAVPVAAQAGQPGLTLTGTVRDSAGKPIANADVFLAASSQPSLTSMRCATCGEPFLTCGAHQSAHVIAAMLEAHQGQQLVGAQAKSDAQGAFRFEHLAGISFTVWGGAVGFGTGVKERAAPGDPVDLFLPAPRRIVGTLRDDQGAPVQGHVRVLSRRLAQVFEVDSDGRGAFEVDRLGEGPFFVMASAPGKLPAVEHQVEAGPQVVTLTLQTPRRLEVRLVKAGKPIDGSVMLTGDHLTRALPSKEGLVVVDQLFPMHLMVTAVSGSLSSSPQAVTLDAPVTKVTLSLEEGGRIAVTVLDESDQPVPEPLLELLTMNGELVLSRKLKTGEAVLLGPFGQGDYQVRASAPGFSGAPVPVALKGKEVSVEITLTRGFEIAGRVIDEYGRPAPGVSVLIAPLGENVIADAEGHFHADVPSAGLYTLQAHHSDWGGGELKVTAPKTDVELQLEPKAAAEITVTLDGRRVEGAHAMLYYPQGNYRSDRPSNADGVVLMRGLPPGQYTLVAMHPDALPSERQQVQMEDGRTLKLSCELKSGAGIKGRVVDTLGAPVANVSVGIGPRAAEASLTDAQGEFELKPLRPKAQYLVVVQQRGYEQKDRVVGTAGGDPVKVIVTRQPVFHGRVTGDGQPLKHFRVDEYEVNSADGQFETTLPVAGDRVLIEIESPGFETLVAERPNTPDLGVFDLKRAPTISGVVRDEGGGAVADAIVSCDTCEQAVTTSTDGRFSIGKPQFQREFNLVAKKGRRTATRTVTSDVSSGIELVLKPGVRLFGTAYLPGGAPAAGAEISGVHVDRSETVSVVTSGDGSYSLELAPGIYRFMLNTPALAELAVDPPAQIINVQGPETRLDLGPSPTLAQLTVRMTPSPGYGLWLVKGEVSRVANPPLELLRSNWAQLIYQPRTPTLTLGGLEPGRYTVVWASFHGAANTLPQVIPVTVPMQGELIIR